MQDFRLKSILRRQVTDWKWLDIQLFSLLQLHRATFLFWYFFTKTVFFKKGLLGYGQIVVVVVVAVVVVVVDLIMTHTFSEAFGVSQTYKNDPNSKPGSSRTSHKSEFSAKMLLLLLVLLLLLLLLLVLLFSWILNDVIFIQTSGNEDHMHTQ